MLALEDLRVARGGRTLLQGIDARFAPGTFTALLGANGVGKSSLLAAMCGVLRPAAGRVLLDGCDVATVLPKRFDPDLKAFADRLLKNGKPPKLVIVAVMRKIIEAANLVLHRGQPWQTQKTC